MRRLPVGLRTVNLSGGEPFLRDDLPEFVREVSRRCPKAQITISTNAFLPDRIEKEMVEILQIDPDVRLAISLDGIGEVHDRIRGSEGVFDRVKDLIHRMQQRGFNGLRLSMTLSEGNIDQLLAVAQYAQDNGLELGIVAAHAATTHLDITDQQLPAMEMSDSIAGAFGAVAQKWLKSFDAKQWLRAHFAWQTYRHLAGTPWRFACQAGQDFFFLQADGTVYSCSVSGEAMGNLADQEWESIWQGPSAEVARQHVRSCPMYCWMICTARSVYRRNVGNVVAWVVWHKLLVHLGLFRIAGVLPASCSVEDKA